MKRNNKKTLFNITRMLKAFSDPNRVRILQLLTEKSLCVCEITDILALATSTVSKHLSILREAGLIIDEKDGKWVNYRLIREPEDDNVQHLLFLVKTWVRETEEVISDRTKIETIDRLDLCCTKPDSGKLN